MQKVIIQSSAWNNKVQAVRGLLTLASAERKDDNIINAVDAIVAIESKLSELKKELVKGERNE